MAVEQAAEKVRAARDLVERKGRRDLGNGDYSVDPGWHTAAELLPVIDSLAAELVSLKDALSVEGLFFKIEYRQGAPGAYVVVYGQGERLASPEEVAMWQRLSKASDAAAREALGRQE